MAQVVTVSEEGRTVKIIDAGSIAYVTLLDEATASQFGASRFAVLLRLKGVDSNIVENFARVEEAIGFVQSCQDAMGAL